jgi:hypothetical protein
MLGEGAPGAGRIPAGVNAGPGPGEAMLSPVPQGRTSVLAEPLDPARCSHLRACRLGIQRFPFPPYRVYLLRCLACETTLTTGSMRDLRKPAAGGRGGAVPPGSR